MTVPDLEYGPEDFILQDEEPFEPPDFDDEDINEDEALTAWERRNIDH